MRREGPFHSSTYSLLVFSLGWCTRMHPEVNRYIHTIKNNHHLRFAASYSGTLCWEASLVCQLIFWIQTEISVEALPGFLLTLSKEIQLSMLRSGAFPMTSMWHTDRCRAMSIVTLRLQAIIICAWLLNTIACGCLGNWWLIHSNLVEEVQAGSESHVKTCGGSKRSIVTFTIRAILLSWLTLLQQKTISFYKEEIFTDLWCRTKKCY